MNLKRDLTSILVGASLLGCSQESPISSNHAQVYSEVQTQTTNNQGTATFTNKDGSTFSVSLEDDSRVPIGNGKVFYQDGPNFEAFYAEGPTTSGHFPSLKIYPESSNLRSSNDFSLTIPTNRNDLEFLVQNITGVDKEALTNFINFNKGTSNCGFYVGTFLPEEITNAYNTQAGLALFTADLFGSGGQTIQTLSTIRNTINDSGLADLISNTLPDKKIDVYNLTAFNGNIQRITQLDIMVPSNVPSARKQGNVRVSGHRAELDLIVSENLAYFDPTFRDQTIPCLGLEGIDVKLYNLIRDADTNQIEFAGELIGEAHSNSVSSTDIWVDKLVTIPVRPTVLGLPAGNYTLELVLKDEVGNTGKAGRYPFTIPPERNFVDSVFDYGDIDNQGDHWGSPQDLIGAPTYPNNPCGNYLINDSGICSLDAGWMILDMGQKVTDGPGYDLQIFGRTFEGTESPNNRLQVLGSMNPTGPWTLIKSIRSDNCDNNSIDLSETEISTLRYVCLNSIYDGSGNPHNNPWSGPDLDAIEGLNSE